MCPYVASRRFRRLATHTALLQAVRGVEAVSKTAPETVKGCAVVIDESGTIAIVDLDDTAMWEHHQHGPSHTDHCIADAISYLEAGSP